MDERAIKKPVPWLVLLRLLTMMAVKTSLELYLISTSVY